MLFRKDINKFRHMSATLVEQYIEILLSQKCIFKFDSLVYRMNPKKGFLFF